MDVDADLVRACQRGEPGALDALVRATYADVYALCRRLLGDADEAADATQEVFVRVTRSVLAFRGDSSFGTWLHRVTVNVCTTAVARKARTRDRGQSAGRLAFAGPDDPRAEALHHDAAGPDEHAQRADLVARTAEALGELSDDARRVVLLRDVEGLSTKEVATMLGVSEGAVKVRLHRAHARLRALVVGGDRD